MVIHRWIALLSVLTLVGCANTAQQNKDLSTVAASGVPTVLQAKMENHLPLELSDIETLSKKKVDDAVTLRYLRSTRVVYTLDDKSVQQLRTAGVSDAIINYLLATRTLYGTNDQPWPLNAAKTPSRDPLLNGQAVPRAPKP